MTIPTYSLWSRPRVTCSWKGQLERTRSWKVWSWKVSLRLERAKRSRKDRLKLESFFCSWKVSCSWKIWMNLESCDWSWKVHHKFQIRARVRFPTSAKFSNFKRSFPTSAKLFNFRLSNLRVLGRINYFSLLNTWNFIRIHGDSTQYP